MTESSGAALGSFVTRSFPGYFIQVGLCMTRKAPTNRRAGKSGVVTSGLGPPISFYIFHTPPMRWAPREPACRLATITVTVGPLHFSAWVPRRLVAWSGRRQIPGIEVIPTPTLSARARRSRRVLSRNNFLFHSRSR